MIIWHNDHDMRYSINKSKYKSLCNFSLACIMISHDAFYKYKARKNEILRQHEMRLVKQCEIRLQKRARKNNNEKEVHKARDSKRKCIKLIMKIDEQHEKCLKLYRDQRKKLKD